MAQLINIGNSQGIRIPKALIAQAELENCELELRITEEGLLVHPIKNPREKWLEAAKELAKQPMTNEDQEWIDADLGESTHLEDWEW